MGLKTKKPVSLGKVFIKYVLTMAVWFLVIVCITILIAAIGIRSGFLITANHVEELTRQYKPQIQSADTINKKLIPQGCKYVVFDEAYTVVKTDMSREMQKEAELYSKGEISNRSNSKKYYSIKLKNGYCVLQYYVRMSYSSELLNSNIPSPEIVLIIIVLVMSIIMFFIMTVLFSKKLTKNLVPLVKTTEKIKQQDLDFTVDQSQIKEFNDVLNSIGDMKDQLKKSLEQQWNHEQLKREQTSSLAHDIKTPLTIIKGNAELLKDSELNDEQQCYLSFIIKNSTQIESYIKDLITVSKAQNPQDVQLTKIVVVDFVQELINQLKALALPKSLKVQVVLNNLPQYLKADKKSLHRAIMNVISNSIEHSEKNSEVNFKVCTQNNTIIFEVNDKGKGFTEKELKYAKKQFYMGDSSRTSKTNFGMGLYIANTIVQSHGGKLELLNNKNGGAKVIISLPL